MTDTNTLKVVVAQHGVRYEAWPHWEMNDGHRVMVGFDLELLGTHDHGKTRDTPGCELCVTTYADLQAIANAILPTEERASSYEILPFDHGLHSEGRGPNEVVLVIRIQHRRDYFSPADSCEEKCLSEMEISLRALGVSGRRRR